MHLRLLLTLNLMVYSTINSADRTKRNTSCSSGCIRCSEVNGCYKCRPRLFLYLARIGMRQIGHCTHSCPVGYFGVRHEDYSICNIDCMAGPWSSWTPCARNGQTCGYKYGITTRSREILEHPSPNGATCPSLVENRCCRMEMRHCTDLLNNKSEFTKWKSLSKQDRKLLRRQYKRWRKRRKKNRKGMIRRNRKRKNETKTDNKKRNNKKTNRLKNKRKIRLRQRKEAWKAFCGNGIVFNDLNSLPLLD